MKTLYTETDFLKYLKDEENIYLYGAGNIGQLTARRLNRYGIRFSGYIETKPQANILNGFPIMSFETSKSIGDLRIVVAVKNEWRREILEKLNGYENVFVVDDHLIRNMTMIDQKNLQFQIHIVEHCNLNCRGCYHFSSLASEEYLPVDEYEKDIKRLSDLFDGRMERILLLGGEPLLHPKVTDFFKVTRNYFPKGAIHILTNGLLLLQMKETFYRAMTEFNVDLWVTKYPVNFDYDEAESLASRYGVKLNYFSREPVRTLGHQPLDISGKQDYLSNFNKCYRANECIDLKHGKLYPCIIPAEIKSFCQYYKLDIPVTDDDYVDIYKANTAEELLEKLGRPIPFCRYCNREDIDVFGVIPWERTKYKIEEWTK